MSIILLKLYSLFYEIKEMLHVHFSQYLIVTYRSRPIIRNKSRENEYLYYVNYLLFILYFAFRVVLSSIVYFFRVLVSLLIVKDRGIVGVGLSFIKITIFLVPLSIISLYLYVSGDVDPAKLKYYQDLHSYRTATAISDNQGNLIGAIPNPLPPPIKSVSQEQLSGTLYVNGVPDVFWDLLKAQEEKDFSFDYSDATLTDYLFFRKSSYKGIDLTSLLKRPFSFMVSAPNKISLMSRIIKNLYGEKYFEQQCSIGVFKSINSKFFNYLNKKVTGLCKKIEHAQAARHLFPYLARFNGLEFKRWSAMHTPLLVSNNDAHGLRSVSAVVFGEKVERLSEAQQALLAASYLHDIRFSLVSADSTQEDRIEKWQSINNHAVFAVENTYRESQPDKADRIIEALKIIQSPVRPKIPNSFTRYLNTLGKSQQQKYGQLFKRSHLFIDAADDRIVNRLKNIYNSIDSNKVVTDLIITLPVIDNNSFIKNIDFAMTKMIKKCTLCFNKLPGGDPADNGALMRIIVSNEQGKIIRYYKKGDVSRRSIASIAKLPASILLASLGDTANTKYCNLRQQGLKNETGLFKSGTRNCSSLKRAGHSFTFKNTFAVSQDLPAFYALTKQHQISRDTLISLYRDFNIENTITLQGNEPSLTQLAYDLSAGKAESTPLEVHKFTHKITQTLFNSEFETDPYTIDQFLVADFSRSVESYYSGALASANTIQQYLKLSSTKAELRKILRAPVYNQGGTLRSFQNIAGVRFLFAKSGTSPTKTQAVKEKWSVGAIKINGQIYSFLIFIGTESHDGLGRNISHRTLIYPIMSEIVRSLR